MSAAQVSLLTCVELVWRLKRALLGRICAEHTNCPSDHFEPAVESGISGVTFVCVFSFPSPEASWCFYLAAKGNTISVIPGRGTVCTPSCLWICLWAEPKLL